MKFYNINFSKLANNIFYFLLFQTIFLSIGKYNTSQIRTKSNGLSKIKKNLSQFPHFFYNNKQNSINFLEFKNLNSANIEKLITSNQQINYSIPSVVKSFEQLNRMNILDATSSSPVRVSIPDLTLNRINSEILQTPLFTNGMVRRQFSINNVPTNRLPNVNVSLLSHKLKNLDCLVKEGYLFYVKPLTPSGILVSNIGYDENISRLLQVKFVLTVDHLSVIYEINSEILRLNISDIQGVRKSASDYKCFNIYDNINQVFKFCQIDNLFMNSCDDWVNEIIKYKTSCGAGNVMSNSQLKIPSSVPIGYVFDGYQNNQKPLQRSIFEFNKINKIVSQNENKIRLEKNDNIKKNKHINRNKKREYRIRVKNIEVEKNSNGKKNINNQKKINPNINENNLEKNFTNSSNIEKKITQNTRNEKKEKKKISENLNNNINKNNSKNENKKVIENKNSNINKIPNNNESKKPKTPIVKKIKDPIYKNSTSKNSTIGIVKKIEPITKNNAKNDLEKCFTKDPNLMLSFYKNTLMNSNLKLKKYDLSSSTYCLICCKSYFKIQDPDLDCCYERCNIEQGKTLSSSLSCIKTHAKTLEKKNFIQIEDYPGTPGSHESSMLNSAKNTKLNYNKFSQCFTKDVKKIRIYSNNILENKKNLILTEINEENFCKSCCKVEFDTDPRGKTCCEERCEIEKGLLNEVSIYCLISHANMLKFDNYLNMKNEDKNNKKD